jgi:hypothetical protein
MTTAPTTTRQENQLTAGDLHLVIACVRVGDDLFFTAVSAPLTFDQAQAKWEEVRFNTRGFRTPAELRSGARRTHVEYYMVRSANDPGYQRLISGPHKGATDALKAWAVEHGYEGRKGGWIYNPSGKPVFHGWEAMVPSAVRVGRIAQGSDGAWYVIDKPMVHSS